MGVLNFIALHHPLWEVRKAVAIQVLEIEGAQENTRLIQ